MDESRRLEAEKSRRSRRWLWRLLGGLVLLAVAAIPAWRYYWHTEYRRHLQVIGRDSRDSYHEPPPWSVLTALPDSLVPVVSRLRTVELTSDFGRPLTGTDIRRLNQIVRYRQFGLGIERLRLRYTSPCIWDGLDDCQDLLYLRLSNCHLPDDVGKRLRRLLDLNALEIVGKPRKPLEFDIWTATQEQFRRSRDEQKRFDEEVGPRQLQAISSLWCATQLEELVIDLPIDLKLARARFRDMTELHHLELRDQVLPEDLTAFADMPALRTLDLRRMECNQLILNADFVGNWRRKLAELNHARPDLEVVPPRWPGMLMLKYLERYQGEVRSRAIVLESAASDD